MGFALAQSTDLSNGVFIAHAPSGLQYTTDPPAGGWCGAYAAIDSCSEQVNHVDTEGPVVWYVLSAWTESKQWCGAQFGLGDYNADNFVVEEHGACFPDGGLTIPTSGWPGPNEGIALTTTAENWSGNFVPVYWMAGYVYGEDVVPLEPDPDSGFAGWARCEDQEETAAFALGGLGLLTDGTYVCPPDDLDDEAFDFDGFMADGDALFENADTCFACPYGPTGPDRFRTIQGAIDSAYAGDPLVIELCDATFSGNGNRNIHFNGKSITLVSHSRDPALCVVDCEGRYVTPGSEARRGLVFGYPDYLADAYATIRIQGLTVYDGLGDYPLT